MEENEEVQEQDIRSNALDDILKVSTSDEGVVDWKSVASGLHAANGRTTYRRRSAIIRRRRG